MNSIAASSPTADFNLNNACGSVIELSLDDFEDEDLSDILHEKDLHLHSYINDSFKVKVSKRSSHRDRARTLTHQIKECFQQSYTATEAKNTVRITTQRRLRPNSLRFFSEPARPGPLPPAIHSRNKCIHRSTSECLTAASITNATEEPNQPYCENARLKPAYSDDTIKNNNIKIENETLHGTTEEQRITSNDKGPNTASNVSLDSHAAIRSLQKSCADCVDTEHSMLDSTRKIETHQRQYVGLTRSASEWSIEDPDKIEYCYFNGKIKEQTHKALFKFVPRHQDEIQLEINDPLHVSNQADDFWYEGINMRNGKSGIFPAYYAQSLLDDMDRMSEYSAKDEKSEQFNIYFLGSVEVSSHKGNDILCQAMHKVAQARRATLHKLPPAYVCLTISSSGIKMMDQSMLKQVFDAPEKSSKLFSSSVQVKAHTHYFRLRNVSFCGHHSRNDKYFAFITRHPESSSRFACHVFVSKTSTRPLAESVGKAFAAFYREYMDSAHPIEDIYIE